MSRWASWWAAAFGIGLASFVLFWEGVLVWHSNQILFPEPRPLEQSAGHHGFYVPSDVGLPYEDVTLSTAGGVELQSWYVPSRGKKAVVMVHGHRENRVSLLKLAPLFAELGFAIFMYDQRHHGRTQAPMFTMGCVEWTDVLAAADWLKGRGHDPARFALFGVSIGAMIAIRAQAEAEKGGRPEFAIVVADSPSSDIRQTIDDYGRRYYSLPMYASRLASSFTEWRSGIDLHEMVAAKLVPSIRRPLMLIHGEADTRIPAWHSRILAQRAAGPVETLFVPGAGHAQAIDVKPQEYRRAIAAFLTRWLKE